MFKDDLARVMKEDHMSQTELAKYLGVTHGAVWHWLKGNNHPKEKQFHMICDLYDLPIERYVKERNDFAEGRKKKAKRKSKPEFDFDGDKLRKMMADRRLSKRVLAEKVGVSKSAPGKWCNGICPSKENLNKLADCFNVAPDYFRKGVEEPFTPKVRANPDVVERERRRTQRLLKSLHKDEEAPIVNTEVVDAPEEPFRCDDEIKQLKKRVDAQYEIIACNEKQIERLKADIDALRELIKKYFSEKKEEPIIIQEEHKKSFWERMFG